MAEREDIEKRIRRLNPKALAVIDEIDKQLIKLGCQDGITVTVTGDMTRVRKRWLMNGTEIGFGELSFYTAGEESDTVSHSSRNKGIILKQVQRHSVTRLF